MKIRSILLSRSLALSFSCFLAVPLATAADSPEEQLRVVLHPTVTLSERWFVTGWVIGNVRNDSPENINLLGGVGYRRNRWATEVLVHRQWSRPGNNWFLESRTQARPGSRVSLYNEVAPFLNKRGVSHLASLDYRAWAKLQVGVETENVFRPGRDSLGGGPRVSYPLFKTKHGNGVIAVSYQFRRDELNALRLWVVIHPVFGNRPKTP